MNRSFLSQVFSVVAISAALSLSTNSAKAALLSYEGFDYADTSLLIGTNGTGANSVPFAGQGGTGWGTGYWSATATGISTNQAGSLSYANGGTLLTTGGKMQHGNPYGPSTGLAGGANATATTGRATLATNQFGKIALDNGVTSLWVSFLFQDLNTTAGGFAGYRQANLGLFNGFTTNGAGVSSTGSGERMAIGTPNTYQAPGGDFISIWNNGASAAALSSGVASPRSGSAAFILLRIDVDNLLATADSISMWVNPSLASEPGTNTAVTINTINLSDLNGFRFQAGNANGSGTNTAFLTDELRFGTTFGDVAPTIPEPGTLAVIGVGLSGLIMAARRKRS